MAFKFNPVTGNLDLVGSSSGGSSTFIGLTDVPVTYIGQATKAVRVNAGETALEFFSISAGGGDVIGPASAVDSNFASYNTTTGKLIKDSGSKASDFATSAQGTKADNAVVANTAIVAGTGTKVTYDAKGLVTSSTSATTADIADSLNKRYVTDANLVTIGNQTNVNSGDNAVNSLYSGLATSKENTITGTTSADFWSGAKTFVNFATTVRATVLTGLSLVSTTVISATDTVLVALGSLQAQITALTTVVSGKASTTTTISTTAPLSGGGDLSANRTLTTSMNTGKLIGRNTAGVGVMEEITLGTNLSMTGTTLNATGGGGSTPTGTGFTHITAGVQDAAAQLVGIADHSATGTPSATTFLRGDNTWATPSGGGGGSTVSGQATVNFGAVTQEDSYAVVTVANTSALTASIISVTPSGVATTDHDPDDYQWDNISGYVSNIINGVSFDIIGVAPNGSWGQYKFNYTIN
jgi:hypothetical protein